MDEQQNQKVEPLAPENNQATPQLVQQPTEPTPQYAPQPKASESVPGPNLVQKRPKSQIEKYGIWVVCGLAGFIVLLDILGMQTATYHEAQAMSNFATIIGGIMALAIGVVVGARFTSQTRPHKNSALKAIYSIIGFIIGFVPGIIVMVILMYPLSKHACELSGSKYC